MKIVCISGYFNPLHIGHIDYIRAAKMLGDKLIVIVNNDEQVKLNGCVPFMNEEERMTIVAAIREVDEVYLAIDTDKTVADTLVMLKPDIFANGGDRTITNIPEHNICNSLGIERVFNVGGHKQQSSSDLVENISKEIICG